MILTVDDDLIVGINCPTDATPGMYPVLFSCGPPTLLTRLGGFVVGPTFAFVACETEKIFNFRIRR